MRVDLKKNQCEKGNVLFLILIAVALFAALSYVVTQSTRSGGGSTTREKSILNSAQMTQYPTMLRTSLVRMILAGAAVENIRFNIPGNQGTISTNFLVFHPNGGGAVFQDAGRELSPTGQATLSWTYNANLDVAGVGTDGPGGNDFVAFLPGVSNDVCRQINERLGIVLTANTTQTTAGIPDSAVATVDVDAQMFGPPSGAYTLPTGNMPDLITAGSVNAFLRQPSGCFFQTTATRNVFYAVLLER